MPGAPRSGSANTGHGNSTNPDLWTRVVASGLAPTGAVYARLVFRKEGTLSGQSDSSLFIWKPQLEESAFAGQEPSPWSPGGTTFINGGRLFANSITTRELAANSVTAEKILVNELSAISANLGTIQVGSANIGNGAITNAKIGNLQVDRIKIADNSVTITHQFSISASASVASRAPVSVYIPSSAKLLVGYSGNLPVARGGTSDLALFGTGQVITSARYYHDGTVVSPTDISFTLMGAMAVAPGTHQFWARNLAGAGNEFSSGALGTLFILVTFK